MQSTQRGGKSDFWWKKDEESVGRASFECVKHLDETQAAKRNSYLHFLRLYSGRQVTALSGSDYAASSDAGSIIRLNVVKSCIDTAVAHIATNRSRPLYQTKGGNYEQRERARRLGKFMLGQFMALKRYIKGLQIFRDAAIFGTGIEKFYSVGGRICSERLRPDMLVYDQAEAAGGSVRQLFEVRPVDRGVLTDLFPKMWKEIETAKQVRDDGTEPSINEPVDVVESIHLPSGEDAKDGRHTIAVGNATLLDETWERERFPYSIFNWSDPVIGIDGIGAAEELASIQREVNYVAQKIQRLMTLATSFVWKEKGSGVGKLTNKDFAQYEYTGRPPIFQTVASVSSEYFSHLDRLYQRAFELMGISQLAAQATKPAGLDSGEALKVYNDIGTKRFQHVGQRWEQFHLDAAECIYDVAADIYADGDDLSVLVAGDHDVEEINFKDAYLEPGQYIMQPHPVSLLPDTPAGQVDTIVKLGQGIPAMAPYLPMLLNGIPDVQAVVDRMTAPIKIAEMQIGRILSDSEFEPPYESMDLQLTRDIATKSLLQAYVDGVPQDRCDLLRRYIAHVDEYLSKKEAAQAQMMPQPMVAGMPQPGMPQMGARPTLAAPPPAMPPVAA